VRWPDRWNRIEAAVTARATSLASTLHGPRHWRAVARVGIELAARVPGADLELVALFALLHDAQRWTDGHDPEHGARAATLAGELHERGVLDLAPDRLGLSRHACTLHADGQTSADPTVGVCWDADRLNLWRVGITPARRLLSTAAARAPALLDWSRDVHARDRSWEDLAERVHRAVPSGADADPPPA
jgi:uncharacterized protein